MMTAWKTLIGGIMASLLALIPSAALATVLTFDTPLTLHTTNYSDSRWTYSYQDYYFTAAASYITSVNSSGGTLNLGNEGFGVIMTRGAFNAGGTYDVGSIDFSQSYSGSVLTVSFWTGDNLSFQSGLTGADIVQSIALPVDLTTFTFDVANVRAMQINPGNGMGSARVDNITVSDVPEPQSWAMMIAGMGLVGATLRRRRRVAIRAAV